MVKGDAWVKRKHLSGMTLTRDEYARSLQNAMDGSGISGTFAHLYINGVYWGIYNLMQRGDHHFAANKYGGKPKDWYYWKRSYINGGGEAHRYMDLWSKVNSSFPAYPELTKYVDTKQYANWVILLWYIGVKDI